MLIKKCEGQQQTNCMDNRISFLCLALPGAIKILSGHLEEEKSEPRTRILIQGY